MLTQATIAHARKVLPLRCCARAAALSWLAMACTAGAQGPVTTLPLRDKLVNQAASASRNAQNSSDDSDVETVIVRPDAFAESDNKIDKVANSLPGANNAAPVKRDLTDELVDYFERRRDPNALSDDTKQTMMKSFEPSNNNP